MFQVTFDIQRKNNVDKVLSQLRKRDSLGETCMVSFILKEEYIYRYLQSDNKMRMFF